MEANKTTVKFNQSHFDKIVSHALNMKKKAVSGRRCFYRTEDGHRCFIGALIPDEVYTEDMEFLRPSDALSKAGIAIDKGLASEIQSVHDEYLMDRWEDELKEIARRHGFIFNKPSNIIMWDGFKHGVENEPR